MLLLSHWDSLHDIAEVAFGSYPYGLRRYALEIECVVQGAKSAALLDIDAEGLGSCVEWLSRLGLAIVVTKRRYGVTSYAQAPPALRERIVTRPRMRLYVAHDFRQAKNLCDLECRARDYAGLGTALGYPQCCVQAAVMRDVAVLDPSGQWRQPNLNAEALLRSTALDYHCNRLLVDAGIWEAPLAAIAHYPCTANCADSAGIGRLALQFCSWKWPTWTVLLAELLRSPVVYWDDYQWPADFWSETCGFVLPSGRSNGGAIWESPIPSAALGSTATPAGTLPLSVVAFQLWDECLLLVDQERTASTISFRTWRQPWILDWQGGSILSGHRKR